MYDDNCTTLNSHIFDVFEDKRQDQKRTFHTYFLQVHGKNIIYYRTPWEKVTMATILVLKYSTTSELSRNIWMLGTFLKYKLAVTL